MRSRLLFKLLGINVLVIGLVMLVVWLALDYLAADYFMVLMKQYNISPTAAHQMFLAAGHRALIWASLGALILAGVLSLLLTRKVLRPLAEMSDSTRRIAAGDYTARVLTPTNDAVYAARRHGPAHHGTPARGAQSGPQQHGGGDRRRGSPLYL